ncbi:MAG TPA: C39 family peptidase [Candidatus Acidoferrales bacterium]|nr:C39 family peptidase [Candidatus Acidoferrales bacterium]
MYKVLVFPMVLAVLALGGCTSVHSSSQADYSHFVGLTDLSNFTRTQNPDGGVVLLSPEIQSPIEWNQLVLSWNATATPGTFLTIEARAIQPSHTTKFYTWGCWSPDDKAYPRASVLNQKDADGDVRADTLALNAPAKAVQIRLTLGGTNSPLPVLKFLGISFCNTQIKPAVLAPNRAAWGKIIPTPERSQQSYPGGGGWCSPTSLSMALARWGMVSNRVDWNLDAPEVAAGVADHGFKFATGNWSYNTAFAGSLNGMRAYVTRFSDISELEDWIAAGIPVMISARYDLLKDGRADDFSGHLTVCRGFTEDGDLVINDPWTDIKVESIRHIYKRANVMRAWATSHNTVYLVYPENAKIPADRFGHW